MPHPIFRWAKRKLYSVAMSGNQVHCPVCSRSFAAFLSYGAVKRPNAQCPNCKSLERHRLMALFFQQRQLFSQPVKLLHVSPESVFFQKFSKNPNIDYYPIDKFEPGYRYPEGTQNVDITQTPYTDSFFDAIICVHVLEHIPDDHAAMRELQRILKPGGWAIILVPMDKNLTKTYEDFSITDPAGRLQAFGQSDHVRLYGLDYQQRLEAAGFQVSVEDLYAQLSAAERQRLALLPGEDIYYCTKSE